MSLLVFGKAADNTHENRFLHQFLASAEAEWGRSELPVIIIVNATWNDRKLDCVVLKPNAVIIVDFKNYGGEIKMSENGVWFASSEGVTIEIKGGSAKNPYDQIDRSKRAMITWFNAFGQRLPSRNRQNPGHIAGLVILHQRSYIDERRDLGPRILSWFGVCDSENCIRRIAESASPEINLTEDDLLAIVTHLGLTSYQIPGQQRQAAVISDNELESDPPESIREAILAFETFLQSTDRVLLISGMIGTGLDQVFSLSIQTLIRRSMKHSVHARNSRIAHFFASDNAQSLYASIYSRRAKEANDTLFYDTVTNEDDLDHVYLLVRGELLSDTVASTGARRYGSGNLFRDYLDYLNLEHSNRKLVIFGDPFQLTAGSGNDSIMRKAFLETAISKPVIEIPLSKMLREVDSEPLTVIAERAAGAIARGLFNNFAVRLDEPACQQIGDDQLGTTLQKVFSSTPHTAKYISYNNEDVSRVNSYVRDSVFGRGQLISAGDVIHVRTAAPIGSSISSQTIPHNSFAEVITADHDVPPVSMTLSGRPSPTTVYFVSLTVRSLTTGTEATFLCFRNYLYASKPENPSIDEMLVLFIDAKKRSRIAQQLPSDGEEVESRLRFLQEDPYLNAAKVRFGYALTVFEGRSNHCNIVIANLDMLGSGKIEHRMNEKYFRYLYTLCAIPKQQLILYRYLKIHPLVSMKWNDATSQRIESCDVFGEAETLPLALLSPRQVVFREALDRAFRPHGIEIIGIKLLGNYQAHYYVRHGADGLVLRAYFDKNGLLSTIDSLKATNSSILEAVRNALSDSQN